MNHARSIIAMLFLFVGGKHASKRCHMLPCVMLSRPCITLEES